jgi:hypothetical protein
LKDSIVEEDLAMRPRGAKSGHAEVILVASPEPKRKLIPSDTQPKVTTVVEKGNRWLPVHLAPECSRQRVEVA